MSPTFNRRGLRQDLGRFYIGDCIVGNTDGSWAPTTGSTCILDASKADPTASGEPMYFRHHLRLLGSAGYIQDMRVASFNVANGVWFGLNTLATTIFSGMPYEVHGAIGPVEKDKALDLVIRDVRYRQEVPIWAIDGGHVYSMGPDVVDVIDVRYFSDPTDSLNRGEHHTHWWKYQATASGNELRISPALIASYQLVVDALLSPTLGNGDLATVNLPSEELVLWGAAARCYWLIEADAPGQEADSYREKRMEAAAQYSRLAARWQPFIAKKIQLSEPYGHSDWED